jgi:AraC family transcriptional regulator of adaptative response / DNA-3-methyladenine glycosylase II
MLLDREICERARRARDPRFDGRFFIGVRTTGIYCRPVCPAPSPKESNVRYFPSAAAAAEAGFRPCLRCRPETSPGTPAWLGSSATVSRALRLISEGVEPVESLAGRLGIGSRQLRRLFLKHLGATPVAVAQTRRLHFAKRLIDETDLPFTEAALAAGFGSVRRFNSSFRELYRRTPSELRGRARRNGVGRGEGYRFRLAFRPPYDWEGVLAFLAPRAIPGIEWVGNGRYRRVIEIDGMRGSIDAGMAGGAIELRIEIPDPRLLMRIVERARRMFDTGADPAEINERLAADPLLARCVERRPGTRIPGAWDEFELAARAVLGQQISVKAATTLAGRIVERFGEGAFPAPGKLARADLSRIGLTARRAETLRNVASAYERGEALAGIPGVGDWTAQYVAMRARSEPDAFPAGDLGLLRASGFRSAKELEQRAERWRPWRAYAAMHLWRSEENDVLHVSENPRRAAAAGRR